MKVKVIDIGMRDGVYCLTIETTCRTCHGKTVLTIPKAHWDKWQDGTVIQTAMPTIPKENRELLISGNCADCWNKITITQ